MCLADRRSDRSCMLTQYGSVHEDRFHVLCLTPARQHYSIYRPQVHVQPPQRMWSGAHNRQLRSAALSCSLLFEKPGVVLLHDPIVSISVAWAVCPC
eukprot:SAG25_NODE_288_length_10343_cov_3.673858_6_plen_97_part_00